MEVRRSPRHPAGPRLLRTATCVALLGLLAPLLAACGGGWQPSGLAVPFHPGRNVAYVVDGSDRVEIDGIVRLLRVLWRDPQVVSGVDPAAVGTNLVWVPESARGDQNVAGQVVAALRAGARVVMAGPSREAELVGLTFGPERVTLTGERYVASPGIKVTWTHPRTTYLAHDYRSDYVAATSPDGRAPEAISGSIGSGSFLWMAVGAGTGAAERFPLLPMMLRDLLGTGPSGLARQGVDLYVDPGALRGADPRQLADRWLAEGVRRIYLAGWEFGFASGNAPYDAYITAAHEHGIAVYAWLEAPVVNDTFYAAHPECHEKTATGADAVGDWRHLVALEDPACFGPAVTAYRQLLSAHDWDGLNIAELYFEGPLYGPDRPALFTPMSPWVRADFRARRGFDPAGLFNPRSPRYFNRSPGSLNQFLAYRKELVTGLHDRLVKALRGNLDVVVTTIDDKLAPSTPRNVGVDVAALQRLAVVDNFDLQYEDPFTAWTLGPRRYDTLHERYPAGTVFDVNVVPRPGGRPTSVPTGSELLVTMAAAADSVGEVALYAEGTMNATDAPWLAGATAAAASAVPRPPDGSPGETLDVRSPFAVWVTGPPGTRSATVDGRPWPLVEGGRALVTAGSHTVAFSPRAPGQAQLGVRGCSCEIGVARSDGALLVYYTSPSRAWLLLDRRPARVTVDGTPLPVTAGADGGSVVALPPGGHTFVVS